MKLTLNQQTYTLHQLPALIAEKRAMQLLEWEEAFFAFMENWFDDRDTITAQTSGSTGEPKTILLKKESMAASARLTNKFFGLQPNDAIFLCLSTNYIAGKMMIVRALVGNLHLIATEPTSCPIVSEPITFAAMVPMQVEELMNTPEGVRSLENIAKLIIGGSAISSTLEAKLQTLSTACYATYGMTETVSHIALRSINGTSASVDYQALEGVWFEQDERDCLVIHAPHLQEIPFVTNDIVKLKSRIAFEWCGRIDNVINSGGIKLFPEMLEKKIASFIAERFFICALPDEKLGQKAVLVIESEPYSSLQLQTLEKQLSEVFNRYENPRQIIFKRHFKETTTGKVKRII